MVSVASAAAETSHTSGVAPRRARIRSGSRGLKSTATVKASLRDGWTVRKEAPSFSHVAANPRQGSPGRALIRPGCDFMEDTNQLIEQRKAKLAALRARGLDPLKNKFVPAEE